MQKWNEFIGGEAEEFGAGPGSYDIDQSVWHVNVSMPRFLASERTMSDIKQCCSPKGANDGGWGIFNAIFGWQNSATYGSVISYNLYWIFVMAGFVVMRFREVKGRWPFMKAKPATPSDSGSEANVPGGKDAITEKTTNVSA